MRLSKEELQKMEQMDLADVSADSLADISEIEMDTDKPVCDRAEEYLRKTGNPYFVKAGEYVVKIGYSDCDETLNDRMKQYIRKIAEIK